jgi:hypothetical protein
MCGTEAEVEALKRRPPLISQRVSWRGEVDGIQTLCLAPPPELRALLVQIGALSEPAQARLPRSGGRLKPVALVTDPAEAHRYLTHVGLPAEAPRIGPARAPPQAALALESC